MSMKQQLAVIAIAILLAGVLIIVAPVHAQDWGRYANGAAPLPPVQFPNLVLNTAPPMPNVLPPDTRRLYETLAASIPKQHAITSAEQFLLFLREPPAIPIKGKP